MMADVPDSRTSPTFVEDLKDPANDRAWRQFLARYRPRIAAWCRGLGVQDVDEVTAEVLLRLSAGIRKFVYDPGGSFRGYVRTIVVNVVRDSFARKQRRPFDYAAGGSVAQDVLRQIEGREDGAAWMGELETDLEPERRLAERAAAVVRAQVAPHMWNAFQMTMLERKKGAETAAALGMSVAAVHQAKCRVLKKLRETAAALGG